MSTTSPIIHLPYPMRYTGYGWVDGSTPVPPAVPTYGAPNWIVRPSVTAPLDNWHDTYTRPLKMPTVPTPQQWGPAQAPMSIEDLDAAIEQFSANCNGVWPDPFGHIERGRVGYASRRDVVERDGPP